VPRSAARSATADRGSASRWARACSAGHFVQRAAALLAAGVFVFAEQRWAWFSAAFGAFRRMRRVEIRGLDESPTRAVTRRRKVLGFNSRPKTTLLHLTLNAALL